MPKCTGRARRDAERSFDSLGRFEHGFESNARSSPARVEQRRQGASTLVDYGQEDEGDLSHDELIQHGRHEEVLDRRMLGASFGSSSRSKGFVGWIVNCWLDNSIVLERHRNV